MGIKLKDLPANVRQQVEEAHGLGKKGRRLSDKEVAGPGLPGRCSCGQRFDTYPAWEKHHAADQHGHSRWDIILRPNEEGSLHGRDRTGGDADV